MDDLGNWLFFGFIIIALFGAWFRSFFDDVSERVAEKKATEKFFKDVEEKKNSRQKTQDEEDY